MLAKNPIQQPIKQPELSPQPKPSLSGNKSPTTVTETKVVSPGGSYSFDASKGVGATPGATPSEDPIAQALNELNTKYNTAKDTTTHLYDDLSAIPGRILALRTKGGAELDEIKKKLEQVKKEANEGVSSYMKDLSERIGQISVDELTQQMTTLKTHEEAIEAALKAAPDANATPAPVPAPSTANTASNVTPPPSTATTTKKPRLPRETRIVFEDKGDKAKGGKATLSVAQVEASLRDQSTKAERTQGKDNKYHKALTEVQIAHTEDDVKNALKSHGVVVKNSIMFGGRRTRKVKRKHSKRAKKSRRRSRKH